MSTLSKGSVHVVRRHATLVRGLATYCLLFAPVLLVATITNSLWAFAANRSLVSNLLEGSYSSFADIRLLQRSKLCWFTLCRASTGTSQTSNSEGQGRRSERNLEDARQLLDDILEVVRGAGPQAGAVRSLQAAQAGFQTAVELFRDGDAEKLVKSLDAFSRGGQLDDELLARTLRSLFQRLGPTYVKLGQFIASSPTLFPEAYVREFQTCLDETPETSFRLIERTVEKELGRPLSAVFQSFDRTPLASASIAQVHAAVLKSTGEDVVVKVQKPGVQKVLQADLGFLYIAARLLEFLNPDVSRTSLVDLVSEIRFSMLGELDFRQELQNMEVFRKFLDDKGLNGVAAVPTSYPEASAARVLTMQRFYGVPLIDLDGIRKYSTNPEATLIAALNVWALSVRECELFHADVHAGNLLVLQDGRVGFIDFGIVGRVPPKIWNAVERFGVGFASNDSLGMATALISMGATDAAVDAAQLAQDIAGVLSGLRGLETEVVVRGRGDGGVTAELGVNEAQVTDLVLDILRVTDSNGLKLPREFALLVKQALYFDRYTKLLAPELDPLQDERVNLGVGRRSASTSNRALQQSPASPTITIDV